MGEVIKADEIMRQSRREPASQATRVEQSRAVAEVQAAFTIAAARPRDPTKALREILESCRMKSVAESAFFKFPRGGKSVTGETIHLAVEMARCWGNISYSIAELERDDGRGISEMLAVATDLETNTSSRTSFIVPHKRDKEGSQGASPLTSMRDIYENNANMGARRLRECIFRVLPTWLIDEARNACYATLANPDDERPLPVRLAEAVSAFEKIGISQERIEAKVGGPVASLTAVDLAVLQISFRSIKRGEIAAEDEFPRVGTEEATRAARQLAGKSDPKPKAEKRQDTATAENPAAAEGPGEEERGEAHNGAEEHPARRVADEIIRATKTVGFAVDLANLKAARSGDIAAMPDDIAADVNAAFDAAEKRLKGGRP